MSDNTITPGKYVALTYTIFDEHDNVVEQHDTPIGFVYGSDTELIGNMDKVIAGKSRGDQVEVKVPPEQGFGDHDPKLTFTDQIENVPPQFRQVGAEVQMKNDRGETKSFFVTRVENGEVTVDGNHPLAGKHLTVRVTITEVRNAVQGEEQVSGIHAEQASGPMSIH